MIPKGKNYVADLRAFDRLPRQVTLAEMRANTALKKMKLLKNVRLLISTITDVEYQEILRMAGIVATPGIPLPIAVELASAESIGRSAARFPETRPWGCSMTLFSRIAILGVSFLVCHVALRTKRAARRSARAIFPAAAHR